MSNHPRGKRTNSGGLVFDLLLRGVGLLLVIMVCLQAAGRGSISLLHQAAEPTAAAQPTRVSPGVPTQVIRPTLAPVRLPTTQPATSMPANEPASTAELPSPTEFIAPIVEPIIPEPTLTVQEGRIPSIGEIILVKNGDKIPLRGDGVAPHATILVTFDSVRLTHNLADEEGRFDFPLGPIQDRGRIRVQVVEQGTGQVLRDFFIDIQE